MLKKAIILQGTTHNAYGKLKKELKKKWIAVFYLSGLALLYMHYSQNVQ